MKKNKRIILTGGGTPGHVTPNVALLPKLRQENWEIYYIGSKTGPEKDLITQQNIKYFAITTGKLHRYFTFNNFLTPFKVLFGIIEALILCQKINPQVVFSKGGFVAFPVVFAAWVNRIPVIVHESDLTPGFANRLSLPFAKKICLTFDETQKYIKNQKDKILVTGTPIRNELFSGSKQLGMEICNFTSKPNKKIILVQGGGLGSVAINNVIRQLIPKLLTDFQIIHICGKNKIDMAFNDVCDYVQFEFLNDELTHVLSCADIVISRAGANSVCELVALKKPHILIPLSRQASRGDQIANAEYFKKLGLSYLIYSENLNQETLYCEIYNLLHNLTEVTKNLSEYSYSNAIDSIYNLIIEIKKPVD